MRAYAPDPVQIPTEARFSAMNSRIKAASSAVKSPYATPDAIAWLEYPGLIVAKISDCVMVGPDRNQNNDGAWKKVAIRF